MAENSLPGQLVAEVQRAVSQDRLMRNASDLVAIPSPTKSAGKVADRLAETLTSEGFEVERPVANWPDSPAVAARLNAGQSGRVLQFNGHLDTVHLPFVPPRIEDGVFYGSGVSDMKGGVAAMLEAMLALRDLKALSQGGVLLTAHDLHEFPWGDGTQLNHLIADGYVGDGVLLPEYFCAQLPVIGRGLAVLEIEITRDGDPVHEVLGGIEQPNVISAGADLLRRFEQLDIEIASKRHNLAGRESFFFGQIEAGEIFNQSPTSCRLAGTRRWLPETNSEDVERQFFDVLKAVEEERNVRVIGKFQMARDAYEIDPECSFVAAFHEAHGALTGKQLAVGAKPFVDDGNAFVRLAGIPAITHGPNATGAHTLNEECPVSELVRVANVYALTALSFC